MPADVANVEKNIGLIGLGLVGGALAIRFAETGFNIIGFDINPQRCIESKNLGVHIASSPSSVAAQTKRIVLSLPDSHSVRDVIFGENGILPSASTDTDIIDTTTGTPNITVEIAERAAAAGCCYVDACIVGSSRQVAQSDAIVIVGGKKEIVDRNRDILETFARNIFHMGPVGKGSETKLVVNLVLGLNRLVLSEGLLLADALQLDLRNILDVLKSGVSYSRVMDTKGEKMVAHDFRPEAKLSQHLKDVNLILELGRQAGIPLRLSELHQTLLTKGVSAGMGDLDNSAIVKVLQMNL